MSMIKAMIIKSTVLFDFIFNNMAHESQTVIIRLILLNSHIQTLSYLPEEQHFEYLDKMFNFCYDFIQKVNNKEVVEALVAVLIDFAYSREQIDKCISWFYDDNVTDSDGDNVFNAKLTRSHKFQILSKIWDEPSFTQELKDKY